MIESTINLLVAENITNSFSVINGDFKTIS